jgi:hypothetical protein
VLAFGNTVGQGAGAPAALFLSFNNVGPGDFYVAVFSVAGTLVDYPFEVLVP